MQDPISVEFPFELRVGYRAEDGRLHRDGVMRLATAGDEIFSMRDNRVQVNPAYHSVIVLSRVVIKLGTLEVVTPAVIEDLFMVDFHHLLRLYEEINGIDDESKEQTVSVRPREALLGNVESPPFPTSFMRK